MTMVSFLCRRLVQTLVILVALSFVLRALLNLMPGDPLEALRRSNPHIRAEDLARLRHAYGLDEPLPVQYVRWVGRLIRGDLGSSQTYRGMAAADLIGPAVGRTLELTAAAFVLSIWIAIPLGVVAAARQSSTADYVINFGVFVGISIPSFLLCVVVMQVFAEWLRWFPPGGTHTPGVTGIRDQLRYLVLPTMVLCILLSADWVRYTRSSMLETLHDDYIRTARAKGADPETVIWRHALRNALVPVVTLLGLSLPVLFSGTLVVETLFNWPGMGKLEYDSIMQRDYNVAMIALLFIAAMTMLCNLLADLLYAVVDPRIRLGGSR